MKFYNKKLDSEYVIFVHSFKNQGIIKDLEKYNITLAKPSFNVQNNIEAVLIDARCNKKEELSSIISKSRKLCPFAVIILYIEEEYLSESHEFIPSFVNIITGNDGGVQIGWEIIWQCKIKRLNHEYNDRVLFLEKNEPEQKLNINILDNKREDFNLINNVILLGPPGEMLLQVIDNLEKENIPYSAVLNVTQIYSQIQFKNFDAIIILAENMVNVTHKFLDQVNYYKTLFNMPIIIVTNSKIDEWKDYAIDEFVTHKYVDFLGKKTKLWVKKYKRYNYVHDLLLKQADDTKITKSNFKGFFSSEFLPKKLSQTLVENDQKSKRTIVMTISGLNLESDQEFKLQADIIKSFLYIRDCAFITKNKRIVIIFSDHTHQTIEDVYYQLKEKLKLSSSSIKIVTRENNEELHDFMAKLNLCENDDQQEKDNEEINQKKSEN